MSVRKWKQRDVMSIGGVTSKHAAQVVCFTTHNDVAESKIAREARVLQ